MIRRVVLFAHADSVRAALAAGADNAGEVLPPELMGTCGANRGLPGLADWAIPGSGKRCMLSACPRAAGSLWRSPSAKAWTAPRPEHPAARPHWSREGAGRLHEDHVLAMATVQNLLAARLANQG